jgi:hypothetical protein
MARGQALNEMGNQLLCNSINYLVRASYINETTGNETYYN